MPKEDEAHVISLGELTLVKYPSGSIWLRKKGGEAMEMNRETVAKLEKVIDDFWGEHF